MHLPAAHAFGAATGVGAGAADESGAEETAAEVDGAGTDTGSGELGGGNVTGVLLADVLGAPLPPPVPLVVDAHAPRAQAATTAAVIANTRIGAVSRRAPRHARRNAGM